MEEIKLLKIGINDGINKRKQTERMEDAREAERRNKKTIK